GIQLGHNRWIAWGATAALCDDVEIYRERLHALEPDRYLVGHEWHKLATRREIISIRAKTAAEKIIRQTRHGPVISDFNDANNAREMLSVRWTAHEPSQELRSVYRINRARNWSEFVDALREHSAPSLNFVYADRDGNIGYCLAGNLPRRVEEPTLLPLAGRGTKKELCSDQRVGSRQKLSVEELANIQLDDVSLHARELTETLRADIARIADQDPTA